MNHEVVAALRAILAETPSPPSPDADPFDIISAVERLTTRREPAIEKLHRLLGDNPVADPDVGSDGAVMLFEIQDRNARWKAALSRARHAVADRRSALERLKRVNRPWNR